MESNSSENILDELTRLSRRTSDMGKKMEQQGREKAEHDQKVQGVVKGLKEISFSIALEQLKSVATPEMVEEIRLLSDKQGTAELRRIISSLTHDLEMMANKSAASNPDMAKFENSVKTLAILIGLLFSIQ